MALMGVSFIVPRMILMASFCALSSFSRLDSDRVVRETDHSQWCWVAHSHTAGTDDIVQHLLKPWLSMQTGLSCTRVLLIRPASCMSAFCPSGSRGIWDCSCLELLIGWTLHTKVLTKFYHTCHAHRCHWPLPFHSNSETLNRKQYL